MLLLKILIKTILILELCANRFRSLEIVDIITTSNKYNL